MNIKQIIGLGVAATLINGAIFGFERPLYNNGQLLSILPKVVN